MTTTVPSALQASEPVIFTGGEAGEWRIVSMGDAIGEGLPAASRLGVYPGVRDRPAAAHAWVLRGATGHSRYTDRRERTALDAVSAPLGRPEATRAALIPIRKSAAWWALAQDERRANSRELGEPFDFLTWFEYAPEHAAAFEELAGMLRTREEWRWVEREVDIRLARD